MALQKHVRTYEIFTWSGQPTQGDTITATLASGARMVFRGIGPDDGYMVASPAFKLDTDESDSATVSRLYRAAKVRLLEDHSRDWIKKHVEFVIQPSDYEQGVEETSHLRVGCGLYVYLYIDKKMVRAFEVEQGYLPVQVCGDTTDDVITQELPRGNSTIISIE